MVLSVRAKIRVVAGERVVRRHRAAHDLTAGLRHVFEVNEEEELVFERMDPGEERAAHAAGVIVGARDRAANAAHVIEPGIRIEIFVVELLEDTEMILVRTTLRGKADVHGAFTRLDRKSTRLNS